ncbi:hypothetical protein [Acinetobacter sp. WZC-1]|uniref:hypothetical protein n=1 Tax=Acinetobacter sp. WZC-1 TaxID=3459034 RepID=UPI00403DE7FE
MKKLLLLALTGISLTGCIVAPYDDHPRRHHHYDRDYRYDRDDKRPDWRHKNSQRPGWDYNRGRPGWNAPR